MALMIETLIHAMKGELKYLEYSAENEVCSSIRIEQHDQAKGFKRALEMVEKFQQILTELKELDPVYANVSPHSKYSSQRTKEPFPIALIPAPDGFIFSGNQNCYHPCDLEFYVRSGDGFHKCSDHNWYTLTRAARVELEYLNEQGTDGDSELSARRALLKELVG